MKETLVEKFRAGRPIDFTEAESACLTEALRRAMAVALDTEAEKIGDDALIGDDLGLDSIDVFDMLDQLAEEFEAVLDPDQLPADIVHGREGLTFKAFAEAFLATFRSPPREPGQP